MSAPSGGPLPPQARGAGFWTSALAYTGGALALQAFNFLLTPTFSHVMSQAQLGLAANYLFWATLFGLVIGLQLHGSLNNAVTRFGADSSASFIRTVMPLYLVPTTLLLAVLLVARDFWERALGLPWEWLVLAVGNGVLFAITNMAATHAVVSGRRVRYLSLMFCSSVGAGVLGLALIGLMTDDALARVWGYVLAQVGALLIAVTAHRGGWGARHAPYLAFALPIALPLLLHEVLFHITNSANRVILLTMDGAASAGVFAFAATLGGIAALMATAINAAWTPWYFARTKDAEHELVLPAAREFLVLFALAMVAGMLVSPELLRFVSAEPFWEGARIVPVFIAVGSMTFVFNLAANYIVYVRRTPLILAISAVAVAINLGLGIALAPSRGIDGVALATIAATTWMALAALVVSMRLGCPNLPFPLLFGGVVTSLAVLGTTQLLADHWLLRWLMALAAVVLWSVLVLGKLRSWRRSRPTLSS